MRIIRMAGRNAKEAQRLLEKLERRQESSSARVTATAKRILAGVRKGGDRALLRYRARLDGISSQTPLQITTEQMRRAWDETSPALRSALETAAKNIREFARRQMPQEWSFSPCAGLTTGQIFRPLSSVGCYVPGGRHPLPSTLLMTVIPAQVAGVARIAVATPAPAKETLAAASLLGVESLYLMGGAQAIAAFAYGTESIRRVRQDRRARKCLRHSCKAAGRFRLCNRYARRAY